MIRNGRSFRSAPDEWVLEPKYLPRVRRLFNSVVLDSGRGLDQNVLDSLRAQAYESGGMAFFLTIGPREKTEGIRYPQSPKRKQESN